MSSGPIASASVKINPDTSTFQVDLQKAVNKAINNLKVPPVGVPVTGGGRGGGSSAAAAQVTALGNAGRTAAKGTADLSKSSSILRGSLIGLSHITPVTVFGLTAYGVAAIAVGTAVKKAIRSTADFEHQLNIFQATTEATASEMKAVSEEAKSLGADLSLPATSAGDAAVAMTELAKAGLTVEESLAGARGVLQLSAAANLDVASSATIVATQLNAFGLAGDQATHVADSIAGASIAAQGEIRDFGIAFQQVAAVSHQVGLSFESTTGALTELAKAGLRGADGGTSLRTTLLRLAPTTKQAAEYQKALGIQIDKNRTIGAQLPQLIDQYKNALKGLSPVLQQQALTQIFGQDAIRAASILIEGGSQALRENTIEANRNGSAARLAEANSKGLAGAYKGLQSNADTLGITLGKLASGPLESVVTGLSDTVKLAGEAAQALIDMNDKISGIKLPTWLTGEDKKDSNVGTFLTNITRDALFLGPELAKNLKGFIEKNRATVAGEKRVAQFLAAGGFAAPVLLPDRDIAKRNFSAKALGEADVLTPADLARAARTTARLAAVDARKRRKPVRGADVTAPRDLQVDLLNAQLKDSLQDELAADKAIESYFNKRKSLAIKGTLRYKQILEAEASAHDAVASVQGQIDSIAEGAASDAKARRAAAKARRDEEKRDREQELRDAAQQAKELFNLEKSRFDLAISEERLKPGIEGDVRANRAEIRFYEAQKRKINAIKKRRKLTIEEQQALVDYQSAIVSLKSTIQGLKGDSGGQGFTLRELFQEAADEFTSFGSNIATPGGILSGQDARASFAQTVLGNMPGGRSADKLTPIANEQLSQAQQQTAYLSQIAAAVSHGGPGRGKIPAPVTGNRGRVGSLEAINAVQAASIWGLY